MEKEKSLLKNTIVVAIGRISTQLITFLLLPLYTTILTTKEFGIVELLNVLIALILPILTLQIEQGLFRYLIDYRDNEEKKTVLISTILKFVITQAGVYLLFFIIISFFIKNDYKYFLASNVIVSMFSSIFLQICRGFGDNKNYSIGSFIVGASTVILNVVFITVFKLGAYGMLGASLISNLLCVLYLFFANKIYNYVKIDKYDKSVLKESLKYSIPLIPNMISWWIIDASDRTIISAFLGISLNGIYATANKFSGVFTTIYNIFNLTWTESASLNIESDDRDIFFSRILDVTIRFFGALMIGIIAFMPFVFPIMVNEKFVMAYSQIPILMIGSMFSVLVSFFGSIYVAKKITKEIAKTSLLAAIINIVINVILIKHIGLFAASISTLIAYFIMFVYRLIDSRKIVRLKVNYSIVCSLIILSVATVSGYYLGNIPIRMVLVAIVVIYSVLINMKSLKFIIEVIKNRKKEFLNES